MNKWPVFCLALSAFLVPTAGAAGQDVQAGQILYDKWCAGCHGFDGAGDGYAADYMLPRPRDFTLGIYQIRTTSNGSLPTDEDLVHVIDKGMPGTAMPGWESKFSSSQINDVAAYIKTFSPFFEREGAPDPLEFGRQPRREGIAEGREFFEQIECFKCHGDAGRGDGPSAPTLQDDLDFPIRAADLTENWNFNGGGSVEDIYRRLRTGMDGSPMPSFSDLIDAQFMTEEQLWHVAQYVHSLSPEEGPTISDVIVARRFEGDLPASPNDSLWNQAEAFYIPMVGQIIADERWFAPSVDGLWVSAAHNDEQLALLIVWHDPSESPDPKWLEWQQSVAASMFPLLDSVGVTPLPDRLTVQFPISIPTGRDRPYFLMGDARNPVYLWQWSSQGDVVPEATATGLGNVQPRRGESRTLASSAVWQQGEWRLQFGRSLATPDSEAELQFATGELIPIAFYAWDGSNGEQGSQRAVSSWYGIHLEQPTPPSVYLSPVIAMALTVGLGLLVVWRAQRREEG
ncbi:MAG: c-type cytochrome [Gemmatimonadota bacterium]